MKFILFTLLGLVLLLTVACGGGGDTAVTDADTMSEETAVTTPLSSTAIPQSEPESTATTTPEPVLADPDSVVELEISGFLFRPEVLEVKVGTTVVWINQDNIGHSVTNGTPPDPTDLFDSGLFGLDESFSYTFAETGEFSYFCTRHNHMMATVVVEP